MNTADTTTAAAGQAQLPIDPPPAPTAAAPTSSAPPPAEPGAPGPQEPHPNAPPAAEAQPAPTTGPTPTSGTQGQGMPPTRGTPASNVRGPLPFEPQNADDLYRYAQMIKDSPLIASKDVRGSVAGVMHLLMLGHSLGLPIHMSLAIHVIEGKPSLPAQTILAICKASPYCKAFTLVESTMDRAVYRAVRQNPHTGEITEDVLLDFTIEEAAYLVARAQKNVEKSAWATQPRTMLRWRCVTSLARQVFPDVIGGLYGTEELRDTIEVEGETTRVVTVAAAEVDGAKPAGGIAYTPTSVNLAALPPPGRDPMDATFSEVAGGRGQADREPELARRPSTTSGRLSQLAGQARGGGNGGPPGYDGPTCPACGGPVARKGQRCTACANQ